MSLIWLNTSVLSNSHSLFISLTSLLILGQDYLNKILFWAFIDSKSTYCFINSKFVNTYYLKIFGTLPVTLCLFDSLSNNTISKIANLLIIFFIGNYVNLDFYAILLDYFCFLILRYNWLVWNNLLINVLIKFCLFLQEKFCSLLCYSQYTIGIFIIFWYSFTIIKFYSFHICI